MKGVKLFILFLFVSLSLTGCSDKVKLISPDNTSIQYNGRIDFSQKNRAILTWEGSSVKIKFRGSEVKAWLQSRYVAIDLDIVLDGDSIRVLQVDTLKRCFVLAENLPDTIHTIEIFKRTNNGDLWFFGFKLNENENVLKLKKRKKIIEFIGDSITEGSSINAKGNDDWRGLNSDNYFTYAAITARHFNAQYFCIAKGGVGLMVGGNPLIMDELYYRKNISDANSKWDFSKVQPDVVVINLFENDANIFNKPDHPQYIRRFGTKKPNEEEIIDAYVKFVDKIKANYPKAKIICSIGSMSAAREDLPWAGYIKKAVKKINRDDVYFCLFPYKNSSGHPRVKDHKIMADTLINFIERNNIW